jgi:hypothetical protein
MELADCMVAIGGTDSGTTVMKFGTTPAEVAVLQAIHGNDAVTQIKVYPKSVVALDEYGRTRSSRAEKERLTAVYGKNDPAGGPRRSPALENLFPGVASPLFQSFADMDLDDSLFVVPPVSKRAARDMDEPDPATPDLTKTSKADLVALAAERGVEVDPKASKAELIAALNAAPAPVEVDDEDGIGDMSDDIFK